MRTSDAGLIQWLVGEWCTRLVQTIESMTGERPVAQRKQSREYVPGQADGILWWRQPLSVAPDAPLWVSVPHDTWLDLGMLTLRQAGIEQADESEARSTFLEILTQSLSGLAQAVGAKVSQPIRCENGSEVPDLDEPHTLLDVEIKLGTSKALALSIAFDGGLLAKIMDAGTRAEVVPQASVVPKAPEATPPARLNSKTLELLMDVELPVSVSFGRAQLLLKDVLKLTTGSIVELNRTVAEPVEVIVNNCVIARGEVVVVEGNYGVRIREIVSRQERLRTLQ